MQLHPASCGQPSPLAFTGSIIGPLPCLRAGDLKAAVAAKMGIPVAQQQLFWHKRELTAAYESRTLLDMNMHTGFAIKGYDLVRLAAA